MLVAFVGRIHWIQRRLGSLVELVEIDPRIFFFFFLFFIFFDVLT